MKNLIWNEFLIFNLLEKFSSLFFCKKKMKMKKRKKEDSSFLKDYKGIASFIDINLELCLFYFY